MLSVMPEAREQGVEHNLLAHKPMLTEQIDEVVTGKLSPSDYPWIGATAREARYADDAHSRRFAIVASVAFGGDERFRSPVLCRRSVTDLIIFVVGGITFEEARCVHELNAASKGLRIVLGGTNVHNSTTFLRELSKVQ